MCLKAKEAASGCAHAVNRALVLGNVCLRLLAVVGPVIVCVGGVAREQQVTFLQGAHRFNVHPKNFRGVVNVRTLNVSTIVLSLNRFNTGVFQQLNCFVNSVVCNHATKHGLQLVLPVFNT